MEGQRGSWALGLIGKGKCWDSRDIQPPTFQEKFMQHRFVGVYDVPGSVLESKATKMKTQVMPSSTSQSSNFHGLLGRPLLAIRGKTEAGYGVLCIACYSIPRVSVSH